MTAVRWCWRELMNTLPSETQLNDIIALCINKHVITNRNKSTYIDIMNILKQKEFNSIIASKYNLTKALVKSLIDGNSVEYAIENALGVDPEFQQHREFIDVMYSKELDEEGQRQILKVVELKLLQTNMNVGKSIFKKFYEHLNEGKHYTTTEEAWDAFEKTALGMYDTYRKGSGLKSRHESSTYTWGDGDPEYYERLRQQMILKYDRTKKTPTGFKFLDDILQGGFERQSLYIFGGNPGAGKSTILLNLMRNAALYTEYVSEMKNRLKLFIFISVENIYLNLSFFLTNIYI